VSYESVKVKSTSSFTIERITDQFQTGKHIETIREAKATRMYSGLLASVCAYRTVVVDGSAIASNKKDFVMAKKIQYVLSSGSEKVEFEAINDSNAKKMATVILSESDVRRAKLVNVKTSKSYSVSV
jgi:hypothetical protein